MPEYRICPIGPDGRFVGIKMVECADDKEAIDQAVQSTDGLDVEIWDRKRFIARLPGTSLKK